jgi:quercetin dioxygenase-like cupin family protein
MVDTENATPLPPDDLRRTLIVADAEKDDALPHIGLVGDTYTITVSGQDTAGQYCIIDMHIPPGGGPGPHRHDFEESFLLLEGELQFTFRGEQRTAAAGATVHIPANAPHQFHNSSSTPARVLCLCAPAGQDELFRLVGVPVATRTTPPPKPSEKEIAAFQEKARELAPRFRTELLERA